MPAQQFYSDMHAVWIPQLQREYQTLNHRYSLNLIPAIIAISAARKILGRWNSEKRTIEISAEVLERYDWETVTNVLKHEMAHQLCSESFQVSEAHGDIFHHACELLDLPVLFRSAHFRIEHIQTSDVFNRGKSEQLLEKIKKLHSLAHSSNEHEAVAAMAKAKQLIDKYQLDAHQDNVDLGIIFRQIHLTERRVQCSRQKIFAILSRFFFVRIIQSSQYNQHTNSVHPVFEIFGKPGNVEFAEHCFFFLDERIQTLWKEKAKTLPHKNVRLRNSYMLGILSGVEETLISQEKQCDESAADSQEAVGRAAEQMLVSLQEQDCAAIEQRISKRYPHLVRKKTARRFVHSGLFVTGKSEGKKLSLREVLHQGRTVPLLTD